MSDAQDELEQEDFATMFARESAKVSLQVGQVVKGRILQIGAETIFVNVGGKGEALIERAEMTDADGNLTVAVGDAVEATVVRPGTRSASPPAPPGRPRAPGPGHRRRGRPARRGQGRRGHQGGLRGHGGRATRVLPLLADGPAAGRRARGARRPRARVPHHALPAAGPQHRALPGAPCSRSRASRPPRKP